MSDSSGTRPGRRLLLEGAVIVTSILLAFAIDALWDRQVEQREEAAMVGALISDFTTMSERLEDAVARSESVGYRAGRFVEVFDRMDTVPTDSLRYWYSSLFVGTPFNPAIPAYDALVAAGRLDIVTEQGLGQALAAFMQAAVHHERNSDETADMFFWGPVWELRREIGTLGVLYGPGPQAAVPQAFELSDHELRAFLRRPVAFAALETVDTARRNKLQQLRIMEDAAHRILELLGER